MLLLAVVFLAIGARADRYAGDLTLSPLFDLSLGAAIAPFSLSYSVDVIRVGNPAAPNTVDVLFLTEANYDRYRDGLSYDYIPEASFLGVSDRRSLENLDFDDKDARYWFIVKNNNSVVGETITIRYTVRWSLTQKQLDELFLLFILLPLCLCCACAWWRRRKLKSQEAYAPIESGQPPVAAYVPQPQQQPAYQPGYQPPPGYQQQQVYQYQPQPAYKPQPQPGES